ncbi:energy transducer TonB [Bacteroides sp. 519]|uniref:energy transducer TonB n=1 Tax=Bacteroides sp. 519 TaxID=2302937 RepID=UPI0013D6358A|nr:hypothetical protein [Bacteroides sp. 519]NDV58968.1 hypothetical protein [Bacteroides sp. 519]
MKLWRYIQGIRKGKDAHQLEKEAMSDPFLAHALRGYDKVKGNHAERIEELQKEIRRHGAKQPNYILAAGIAASVLLLIGIGSYLFIDKVDYSEEIQLAAQYELKPDTAVPVAPLPPVMEMENIAMAELKFNNKSTVPTAAPTATQAPEVLSVEDELNNLEDQFADMEDVEMEEVVVVGYGRVVKKSVTGAVGNVSADTMNKVPRNVMDKDDSILVTDHGAQKKTLADEEPKPVDGKKKYNKYIKENLVRPTDGACSDSKGKVILRFNVNAQGRPTQVVVEKSLCPSADQEAIRLLTEGPNWTVGGKSTTLVVKF